MLSLLYLSRSCLTEPNADRELDGILTAANARNLREGITGALVFTGRDFAQVLEGEESAVARVMGSILLDRRHDDVRIVSRETISARIFPNWGMTLIGHQPHIRDMIETVSTAPNDGVMQQAVSGLANWMKHSASARVVPAAAPA